MWGNKKPIIVIIIAKIETKNQVKRPRYFLSVACCSCGTETKFFSLLTKYQSIGNTQEIIRTGVPKEIGKPNNQEDPPTGAECVCPNCCTLLPNKSVIVPSCVIFSPSE